MLRKRKGGSNYRRLENLCYEMGFRSCQVQEKTGTNGYLWCLSVGSKAHVASLSIASACCRGYSDHAGISAPLSSSYSVPYHKLLQLMGFPSPSSCSWIILHFSHVPSLPLVFLALCSLGFSIVLPLSPTHTLFLVPLSSLPFLLSPSLLSWPGSVY